MLLTDIFKLTKSCTHEGITPDMECGYCPDCGKFVENEWYITRCSCCGVKLRAFNRNGNIIPQFRYCANCGSNEFTVEKLEKINFVDINFAVLVKKVIENKKFCTTTQCWQEKTSAKPILTVRYRQNPQ